MKRYQVPKELFSYNPCPQIPLEKWLEILNYEQLNQAVIEIREKILEEVFKQAEKIDKDKECAQYVVNCAYEAWKKILLIEFFNRDPTVIDPLKDPLWTSDKIPEVCSHDSWAANQVKVQKDKNIFYFGDNPPEASKMSLKDEGVMVLQEASEYADLSTFSKSSESRKTILEEHNEDVEEQYIPYEEEFSDSLEERKSFSVFTFTKKCLKPNLPFMPKEFKAYKNEIPKKSSCDFENKVYIAKGRNFVNDMYSPLSTGIASKQRFTSISNKKLVAEGSSKVYRRSLLPAIQKK